MASSKDSTRVAAIDIGTNTVLLLIAERRLASEALVAVHEAATITRLGQGVDQTRTLAPEAIERTRSCLADYARVIREHGVAVERVGVVGTSAMRDAHGGDEVVRAVRELLGVEPRVIAGEEEARLTFMGALGGMSDLGEGPVVVFDIGGGSTEIVRGEMPSRAIELATSLDVGSVRLTERHFRSDPPTDVEKAALVADVKRAFAEAKLAKHDELRGIEPIGIAGTVTTLAAVARSLVPYDGAKVHGARLSIDELRATVARLASVDLTKRRAIAGLEPKRADVIVAGGLLTLTLLEALGATSVRISDRGVRWGLAEQLAV